MAAHLNLLFDDVISTHDGVNLKSAAKAKTLVDRYGAGGFDYAGNQPADLKVFAEARYALIVNPTRGLRRKIEQSPTASNWLPRAASNWGTTFGLCAHISGSKISWSMCLCWQQLTWAI